MKAGIAVYLCLAVTATSSVAQQTDPQPPPRPKDELLLSLLFTAVSTKGVQALVGGAIGTAGGAVLLPSAVAIAAGAAAVSVITSSGKPDETVIQHQLRNLRRIQAHKKTLIERFNNFRNLVERYPDVFDNPRFAAERSIIKEMTNICRSWLYRTAYSIECDDTTFPTDITREPLLAVDAAIRELRSWHFDKELFDLEENENENKYGIALGKNGDDEEYYELFYKYVRQFDRHLALWKNGWNTRHNVKNSFPFSTRSAQLVIANGIPTTADNNDELMEWAASTDALFVRLAKEFSENAEVIRSANDEELKKISDNIIRHFEEGLTSRPVEPQTIFYLFEIVARMKAEQLYKMWGPKEIFASDHSEKWKRLMNDIRFYAATATAEIYDFLSDTSEPEWEFILPTSMEETFQGMTGSRNFSDEMNKLLRRMEGRRLVN